MLNCLSFFKSRGPKPPQIGKTGYQCTPFYLYIKNIKVVLNSSEVSPGLEWENLVFHPTDCQIVLAFSNLGDQNHLRQDKLGINVLYSSSTLRILRCFWTLVKFDLDQNGKIQFTPYRMLNRLSFFKLVYQNHIRQDKLGINVLHSTSTFRILRWFWTLVKFHLDQNGKIQFYTLPNVKSSQLFQTQRTKTTLDRTNYVSMYSTLPLH